MGQKLFAILRRLHAQDFENLNPEFKYE